MKIDTTDDAVSVEPHAVRWAQRYVYSRFETDYSKWHWTEDAAMTLCGRPILLIADGPALLPETYDDPAKVTCQRCRQRLAASGTAQRNVDSHS